MTMLTALESHGLAYVRNTSGGATKAIFIEDHAPVGERLWQVLVKAELVEADPETGRIWVTLKGRQYLDQAERKAI